LRNPKARQISEKFQHLKVQSQTLTHWTLTSLPCSKLN